LLNFLDAALRRLSPDLAIDLGTSNTRVVLADAGVVVDEPSVVAVQRKTRKVLAVGTPAWQMIGRTPANQEVIRPLSGGAVGDFDATCAMLRYFLGRAHTRLEPLAGPRVLVAIPSGATDIERIAVHDSVRAAGAREVFLIEAPIAAALGVGLPVAEPLGCMVVDVGGGICDVAVLSLGDIGLRHSLRQAGNAMSDSIATYARQQHNLLIGDWTAEEVKMVSGSAWPQREEVLVALRGREVLSGLPRSVNVSSIDLRKALRGPLGAISDLVRLALEQTPPELLSDVQNRGIALAGGATRLAGFDRWLCEETGMPVYRVPAPQLCVARGLQLLLRNRQAMDSVAIISPSEVRIPRVTVTGVPPTTY
jgi:rod shape-determining protein MreB